MIIVSTDQALKEQIISKAWEDEAFKKELLANPKAAMNQSFGIEFPDDIEVAAVTESSRKFYLIIPPKPIGLKVSEPKEFPRWP